MEDLIRRSDALIECEGLTPVECKAMQKRIKSIPAVEPNLLISPETIERGSEVFIGEDIVVVHHDDFMDMQCKAMMWDEYGKEPKQGEWIKDKGQDVLLKAFIDKGEEWRVCSVCGIGHKIGERTNGHYHAYFHNYCPNCGARMKGADDE